jgi:hypothetical protein
MRVALQARCRTTSFRAGTHEIVRAALRIENAFAFFAGSARIGNGDSFSGEDAL